MKFHEIHKDSRGSINILTEDMALDEVTVFTTRKGFARGGCIHNINDEYTCVVEGEVEYCIGDETQNLKMGESLIIPKGTPHYFVSLTDSIVLEWGASPAEKMEKHAEFRRIVEKINENIVN